MRILADAKNAILEFLFPKTRVTLSLESLNPDELWRILPRAETPKDSNIVALFDYKHDLVRNLIWELKYNGNKIIADKFGQVLFDTILEETMERALLENFSHPLLVPMPVSDKRKFERGWNQAELLTQAVKGCDKAGHFKYLPRQLVKFRHTESQTKTSDKKERLSNLQNSMKVLNKETVREKCVILVDDVTTTGATFAEARRALREAGVRKVLCVAIAH